MHKPLLTQGNMDYVQQDIIIVEKVLILTEWFEGQYKKD